MQLRLLLFTGFAVTLVASSLPATEPAPEKIEYFEKKVRPILVGHCYACHSADTKPSGGLRVDDRNGLLTGGNTGPAVVPGQPDKSLLLKRVTQDGKKQMPLEGEHLTPQQVAVLTTWIKDGAAWPTVRVPESLTRPRARFERLKKEHWAWQPLSNPKVPAVRDPAWARSDIDRFLLAKLEANNLKPVADADKVTLLRRVTFDLTGLPPTPTEVAAFVNDTRSTAFEKVVDRLLASPRFGEHWGRHWLDVARYGESTGPSRNIPYPHAWRYRDYVIDAVNADLSYNQFVREQLAGDLLPASDDDETNRRKVATGFLAVGVKDVNQRFKVRFLMDNVDEQIDVVTRSILGLTVSCARCHDHKFDPVPMVDYYALAGIFTSTDNAAGVRNLMGGGGLAYYVPDMLVRLKGDLPPPDPKKVAQLQAEVKKAKEAFEAIRGTPEGLKLRPNGQPVQRQFRVKLDQLQEQLNLLTDPAQRGLVAHGVRDAKVVGDTEVRLRGEAEKLGPTVPRGFLTTFTVPDAKPINSKQSGRLELAEWLVSEKNPLTPRVFVNRTWKHLFGRGLVSTVDNFGVTGDGPTHPELLDHLATTFIAEGWSLKKLVRQLVLTRAYQLSGETTPEHLTADPANKLVWRQAPRRLTADQMRDALLAVTGTLDLKRPQGSAVNKLQMREMRDNGPEAKIIHDAADASRHRSVYLPLMRGLIPKALEVFDPAEQTLVTGNRDATTVPSQALFMLNSPFVRGQAETLAVRLLSAKESDDKARIQRAYQLTLGRQPSEKDCDRAQAFLSDFTAEQPAEGRKAAWTAFVQALFASAEFRYVR